MFFESEYLNHFVNSAFAGLGHAFGQRFFPWISNSWNRLRGRGGAAAPAQLPNSEALLRPVNLEDLVDGIPEGFQLCRYKGRALIEKYVDAPPERIADDESLWLVPTGPVVVSTGVTAGDASTTAEVAVEFSPDDGLVSLLTDDQELSRGWLEGLVAGGLLGVVTSLGHQKAAAFIKGDATANDGCRDYLNRTFKDRGLRCTSVRATQPGLPTDSITAPQSTTQTETPPPELAAAIAEIRSQADWKQFVLGLRTNGLPVDDATSSQLDELRDGILAKSIEPNDAVNGLARMTVDAFERAGITQADLGRWQTISDRLESVNPTNDEDVPPANPKVNVSVAKSSRPSTWLAWDRVDVDRRQLRYTGQGVRRCRSACDQALQSLRDLPSMRQIRELNEQLKLIEELLSTTPTLEIRTSSLKLDSHMVKSLLKSLEQAVLATEQLTQHTDQLFAERPASEGWQQRYQSCMQNVSTLVQLVRDRRAIR